MRIVSCGIASTLNNPEAALWMACGVLINWEQVNQAAASEIRQASNFNGVTIWPKGNEIDLLTQPDDREQMLTAI
ncbi:hypothetical protein [Pantoea agglomerans]|uniref:hypothetical protein n=1 Tax=Enterobacter agglomerans TaxID=549 RepID=UPI0013DE6356|nr:hypothetical protein [Pantoea agglomerans]